MSPPKKTAKKPAARSAKRAPAKKTARKKKKQTARPVLLAFAAGLIIACAAAWLLRDVSLSTLFSPKQEARQTAESSAKGNKPKKNVKANSARQDKNNIPQAKKPSTTKGKAPVGNKQPAITASLGSSGDSGTQRKAREKSDIASALQELQDLAYEEDLAHPPLADRVRQVDYAIMQAAWINKIPASSVRQVFREERGTDLERYSYQRIAILPGTRTQPFVDSLRDCLALWADGASITTAGGKDVYGISIGNTVTHTLRLYPEGDVFPSSAPGQGSSTVPLGSQTAQRPPDAPVPGMANPRLRASNETPKLTIVIDDLGESPAALRSLLALDYPVTCAFWPHGSHTADGARAAHAKGQEIIVHQPMEPMGYPKIRPGPNVLLSGMAESEVHSILQRSIAAVPHAVGLNNHMGSRFTQNAADVRSVIRYLKKKNLFMLDSFTHSRSVFIKEGKKSGLQHYRRNVFLDTVTTRENVINELRRAERIARFTGQAVAIGHPHPATIAGLREWQNIRDKSIKIVRLSDLAQE